MNLLTETRYKLNYSKNNLGSLQEVDKSELTKDARHYVDDEIAKAKRNIEYYEGIMKVLEEKNSECLRKISSNTKWIKGT